MAQMIPDRMPRSATHGEKAVFNLLRKLPEENICNFEPVIRNRYPDFIVILPARGVLVIEIKGWKMENIYKADNICIGIEYNGLKDNREHPIQQAKGYMVNLLDFCKYTHPELLDENGKFRFRFEHLVILTQISGGQLDEKWEPIFPVDRVITKDIWQSWLDLKQDELLAKFHTVFQSRPIEMDELEINTLRALIHPEIHIKSRAPVSDLGKPPMLGIQTLDLRQENHARSLGEGHRIIYGVAGSGKTLILLTRARLLAQNNSTHWILVLCFNVMLSVYLKNALKEFGDNIYVIHFDGWCSAQRIFREKQEDDESLGERLLE